MTQSLTHVATLIAAPGTLSPTAIERARAALAGAGDAAMAGGRRRRRHPLYLRRGRRPTRAGDANLRGHLAGVDVVVQPAANRRKKLFLADMDSTMIGQECIDELADFVGLKAHVAAITERAMRGEIAFEPALRERVALLEGLAGLGDRRGDRQAHHADAGRAHAGRHHARQRRLHLSGVGRLHAVHRPHRRHDRLRRDARQYAASSTATRWPAWWPSRSSAATPSARR